MSRPLHLWKPYDPRSTHRFPTLVRQGFAPQLLVTCSSATGADKIATVGHARCLSGRDAHAATARSCHRRSRGTPLSPGTRSCEGRCSDDGDEQYLLPLPAPLFESEVRDSTCEAPYERVAHTRHRSC